MKNMSKKKALLLGGAVALVLIVIIIIAVLVANKGKVKTDVVYKEVETSYGALAVGVTDDTTVSIGTVSDTFDVDITALVRTTSSNSTNNSGGMGDMMGGGPFGGGGGDMFSMMSGGSGMTTVKTNGNTTLEVEEVVATEGSRVEVGDPIYKLSEESISALRDQLVKDVEEASDDLKKMKSSKETTLTTAKNTYASSVAYGQNAQGEYDREIKKLEDNIASIKESIADTKEAIAEDKADLEEIKVEYTYACLMLETVKTYTTNGYKNEAFYSWMTYRDLQESAQKTVDSLESQMESLESDIEKKTSQLSGYDTKLTQAQKKLETGTLSAKETYELRLLAYENAQEAYDISVAYAENNVEAAEETLATAQSKLDEFDSQISGVYVYAQSSGVITELPLAAGDTLTTGTTLYTLYDDSNITVTGNVYEDELENIEVGTQVNLVLVAFPDTTYNGKVTEISDASYDNSGNIYYTVTATIGGDVEGLYEGMTGKLTFVTKEVADVVYVSNRSIFQDGTRFYVKQLDGNGNIVEKEVSTGFSDGVNVEVISGLEVGEKVLIESKVTANEN